MKKHRLGVTAKVWSTYLRNRLGFSAKSGRSLFALLCVALRGDGFQKPDGISDREWAKRHAWHIEAESNKIRGLPSDPGKSGPVTVTKPPKQKFDVNPATDDFLRSFEWRRVRMMALRKYGARCQCCGSSPAEGAVMNVDHIKPRKLFPHLALDVENLQVLCEPCNHGKGNWDQTDWRPSEIEPEVREFIRSIARES